MRRLYRTFLYFSLFIFHYSLLSAQQTYRDSLFSVLKAEKDDTNKVNTLLVLSSHFEKSGQYNRSDSLSAIVLDLSNKLHYINGEATGFIIKGRTCYDQGNYPEALKNLQKARELYKKTGNKTGIGDSYLNIGNAYDAQANYSEALENYLQAHKTYEEAGYKSGMADANGNIGIIYKAQGNYPAALKNYLQSLKLYEELGYKKSMAINYGNIGNIYFAQGNHSEALKNYTLAIEIDKKFSYKKNMAINYRNSGNVYFTQGNYPEALKNYQQALKIDEEIGNKTGMGYSYLGIGSIYFAQGNYSEALKSQMQALSIYEKTGNKAGVGGAYINLGGIYTKMKKVKEAKLYLDSAIILNKNIGEKDQIRDSYQLISAYDSMTGDFRQCYADYKNYILYRDSLKNKDFDKKILSQQMNFDFQHKEDSLTSEDKQKEALATAETKKQKIITVTVAIGLFLALLFGLFVFRSLRITRSQKDIIETKNKEILDSITYAKRLQDAILPPAGVIKKHLPESFVLYKPKDIVAGDFYWMERPAGNDDVILLAACDCTGHGVPGAMVSVVCSNALNRTVKEFKITEPGKILDKVRELVLETFEKSESEVKDGMDISLASLSTSNKDITISWAGAYNPLWFIINGELKEITADKQPIGKSDNPKPFTTHTITLNPLLEDSEARTLYLFTDGYADQFGGPKGKKFKYKQLQQLLVDNCKLSMPEQRNILEQTLENWRGSLEQVDDILIIGIRV